MYSEVGRLFFIHYTFDIRSMCKTIEEAETHMDYR
ncbi:UNVERIFIED_ORG: hypothetical protein QFZ59_003262 [Bacillus sp. B2I3]|nr:hypothetical protein [Bacillus sp. B2I3]